MDKNKPMFTIGTAAQLAELHPQTLRVYEAKGLITPARTPGGTRMYSLSDIERIEHITGLSEAGVNIEGITRILALERENEKLQDDIVLLITQIGKLKSTLAKERRRHPEPTTTAIVLQGKNLPMKLF